MYLLRITGREGEDGQALMESALLITLIAVVVVGILTIFGRSLHTTYCSVTHQAFPDSDISSTCEIPIVTSQILDQGPNQINVEADVYDPDGNRANPHAEITKVEFYLDGTDSEPVAVENHYHYCLGGGDSSCNSYDTSGLSPGSHTIIILAYDSDGNVGRTTLTFRK